MSAIDELSLKFKSGNNVPVEFARFSPEEWAQVVAERDKLQAIISGEFPEGCTPADARMLRKANHGLADENYQLRARVAELVCKMCGGHGQIGGLLPGDGGYDGESCPDCGGTGINPSRLARIKADAVRDSKRNLIITGIITNADYNKGFDDAIDKFCAHLDSYANKLEAGNG